MKVSIVMITYNHERFLKQALDGILKQKTSFEYELIVGEDCSPDGSRDLIQSYIPRFQGKLKPIFRPKNLGAVKNMLDTIKHCSGEYLAFLEGDDYWICEDKLEKQIAFLESHKDYSAVFHECCVVDQDGRIQTERLGLSHVVNHEYTVENLERFELPGQTGTIVMRNILKDSEELAKKFKWYLWIPLDRILVLLLLKNGRIYIMDEVWSAYRHYIEEGGSNWSSRYELEVKRNYLYFYFINQNLERVAHEMGISIDTFSQRFYFFQNAFYYGRKHKRPDCLLQCLLMFMAEKQKMAFLRKSNLLSKAKCRLAGKDVEEMRDNNGSIAKNQEKTERGISAKGLR